MQATRCDAHETHTHLRHQILYLAIDVVWRVATLKIVLVILPPRWIVEDVTANEIVDALVTNNMFVITLLPQMLRERRPTVVSHASHIQESGFALQALDKFRQIIRFGIQVEDKMKVIGHDYMFQTHDVAVGRLQFLVACLHHPTCIIALHLTIFYFSEKATPLVRDNRDEIIARQGIIISSHAHILSLGKLCGVVHYICLIHVSEFDKQIPYSVVHSFNCYIRL